jgi:hypothetical protein
LKLAALSKVKRNKPLMVLLLPVIVCIFLAGWAMYLTGRQGSSTYQKKGRTEQTKDHVIIGAIPFEEEQEILAQ